MLYDFTVKNNKGQDISLNKFSGKVLLIVNTATKCGLTPQYEGLQKLYAKYKNRGFEILDFPCNQFLEQAPGSDDEISEFCTVQYQTQFPRFAKIHVNGEDTCPLYHFLKDQQPSDIEDDETPAFHKKLAELNQVFPGSEIKWNFTKFLCDREGNVVARYAPTCSPEALETAIEKLL